MTTIDDVAQWLEAIAPVRLAADWDNVGLLVGDRTREARRVLTCLTITAPVVDEAVADQVDLIVAHHPLPFRPLKTLTTDSSEGRLLWRLATTGISVYSAHTAYDSAATGINQALADGFGLVDIEPLEPIATSDDSQIGVGRCGRLVHPMRTTNFAAVVKTFLKIDGVEIVGDPNRTITKVGIVCGSAGELLTAAHRHGCDCFVTGEARFHTALDAEARDVVMLLVGHYAGERFGMERLAADMARAFATLDVRASQRERDPLRRL